mmetsp:Transcript_23903/g.32870  ORF Transcript_23903/g.32870 Transcript_23903/m.32870 type:complete len:368 (+) Transcript_23903:289-1392(+)
MLCFLKCFIPLLILNALLVSGLAGILPSIRDRELPGWLGEQRDPMNTLISGRGMDAMDSNTPSASGSLVKGAEKLKARYVEQISWQPRAWRYHNFLTPDECQHIKERAAPALRRSTVVDAKEKSAGSGKIDNIRTSSGMFLDRGSDEVQRRIEERIAQFSMLPVANGEALQVLHYEVGQEYKAHQDTFLESMIGREGQRIATALMFLNTPELGGETIFPNARPLDPDAQETPRTMCGGKLVYGVGFKPNEGDLVLFWDTLPDGKADPHAMHQACPVVKGEKWSAPKWIHTRVFGAPEVMRNQNECDDRNEDGMCRTWAQSGECKKNIPFMVGDVYSNGQCIRSCIEFDDSSVPKDHTCRAKIKPIPL